MTLRAVSELIYNSLDMVEYEPYIVMWRREGTLSIEFSNQDTRQSCSLAMTHLSSIYIRHYRVTQMSAGEGLTGFLSTTQVISHHHRTIRVYNSDRLLFHELHSRDSCMFETQSDGQTTSFVFCVIWANSNHRVSCNMMITFVRG